MKLKKLGKVFFVCGLLLGMHTPAVMAKNYNIADYGVSYHDYVSFVVAGKEYEMRDLMEAGKVDLSGVDRSAEVTMQVDIDGLNQALEDAGKKPQAVHQDSYISRYESSKPTVYHLELIGDDTYAIVDEDNEQMTLEEFAYVSTVLLYLDTAWDGTSVNRYYGIDTKTAGIFHINVAEKKYANARFHFVDAQNSKVEYASYAYTSKEMGEHGTTTLVKYKDLPMPEGLVYAGPEDGGAYITYGYKGVEHDVLVIKEETDFSALQESVKEAEALLQNAQIYEEDGVKKLQSALLTAQILLEKGQAAIQFEVNDAKDALDLAMDALVYVKADYTKVNAALEKAMALDPSDYQDFSAVKEAIDKVIFDLDITKQKQVDAMAEAIFHAIDQLKEKEDDAQIVPQPSPITPPQQNTSNQGAITPAPNTGDTTSAGMYLAFMMVSAGMAGALYVKRAWEKKAK